MHIPPAYHHAHEPGNCFDEEGITNANGILLNSDPIQDNADLTTPQSFYRLLFDERC